MDKKSKIFFIVFALLIAGSVAMTYWRIVVKRDYLVLAQTSCDPEAENCFVYECDPESEECTGNPEEDISYYAKIKKKAFNFPECTEVECPDPVCEEGEGDCELVFCTEEEAEEWESCNNPEEYRASLEEESDEGGEAAEGDGEASEEESLEEGEEEAEESNTNDAGGVTEEESVELVTE